jgi:transcriptional regulator of acetoin/glycerol metabolism
MAHYEVQLLRQALQACQGHVPSAARQLGMGRATLYKKLAALGINPSQF